MPIRFEDATVRFEGACGVEEALPLSDWLLAREDARVDLGACTELHTAVLQVLMAAKRPVTVAPTDPFLALRVMPVLNPSPRSGRGGI
ncbi:MAG TPA: hypothetical protein VD978_29720 [Azospirillum sp.]|nr:hypothetical protein [Azospirillum sp.]